MDDYADIYYVDTRNADHRTNNGSRPVHGNRVPSGWSLSPAPRGPMQGGYPQPMMVAQPAPSFAAAFLGKLTSGQVIDMVAQLFAVLAPLPAVPAVTKDAATDAGNLILFQSALASYAKRDEQVRTLGGLVGKLVG
jgi:hypothetical protein